MVANQRRRDGVELMLIGTADLNELGNGAATIEAFLPDPVTLGGVECFQVSAEMRISARQAVLPPALHPTTPASISLQAWNVSESPWGAFSLAFCRVSCRSGMRARGFTTRAVATTAEATSALRDHFGFPCELGEVQLNRHYDRVDLRVALDNRQILLLAAIDPDPLRLEDVQYTGTMNLAQTPHGLRLIQVESNHQATRVERLRARILEFDGSSWGNSLLDPYHVIASSIALEDVTLPPVRFQCKPDELAFTGTESVNDD